METSDIVSDFSWLAPLLQDLNAEKPPSSATPITNRPADDQALNRRSTGSENGIATRPFLLLPPEIRERIYQHALTVDVPADEPWVTISKERVRSYISASPGHCYSCLAILETCKQVYHEAWHLFYQCNTFCVLSATDLFCFLDDIGSARRNEIASVRCEFDLSSTSDPHRPSSLARDLLSTCVRLKHLQFDFDDSPEGHDARPFRQFGGLETATVRRLTSGKGSARYRSRTVLARILAYEGALKRRKPLTPVSMKNDSWWYDDLTDDETGILRILEEVGDAEECELVN